MMPKLSGVSSWHCNVGEFRFVATVVANFAVLLRLSGMLPVATTRGNSAVLLGGYSTVLLGGNFAVLLKLSGIAPCCYGNGWREFRSVATIVGNFTALVREADI